MLQYETFVNGLTLIKQVYLNFNISEESSMAWYEIIKCSIEEDAFLPLIFNYCKTESTPTCPADLIQFGRKILISSLPEPAIVANLTWDAVTSMIFDDNFNYQYASASTKVEYLVNHIISINYAGNQLYYKTIKTVITKFLDVLVDSRHEQDATRKSILTSEFKTAYKDTMQDLSSRVVFTAGLLKASTPLLLER